LQSKLIYSDAAATTLQEKNNKAVENTKTERVNKQYAQKARTIIINKTNNNKYKFQERNQSENPKKHPRKSENQKKERESTWHLLIQNS
jgi:hypothetical protein